MIDWEGHEELQEALQEYLSAHGLALSGDESYQSGIDCVGVFIQDCLVLSISLPPVSNYRVRETIHTDKYLRTVNAVAV